MEPPRVRVNIISVDTVNLTAVGVEPTSLGAINIDLRVHNSQTVIYPRENEEWFLTKINDVWVLDKKGGFGNEGLLREASPGDQVTVTDGNYVLDAKTTQIVGPTTVEGHLTANTDFTVWGNTDVGNIQIYGILDQRGDLHMHGYKIFNEGGLINTGGGNIICGQINSGNIWAEQIVGQQNSFFDKYVRIYDLQVTHDTTLGGTNFYGTADHHGNTIYAGGIYANGLQLYGGQINAGNIFV